METLIFLVCLAALFLGKPRLRYSLPLDGSHVAHERTLMINGFFMVMMLLRHISIFCCPVQPEDEWYYTHVDAPLVQCIVCTYFFYSGYGIISPCRKRGGSTCGNCLPGVLPACMSVSDLRRLRYA